MGITDVAGAAAGALLGAGEASDQITLTVDGKRYAGWTEINVERSLDMFAHQFSLGYTDRWVENAEPWPIRSGAKCQVHFGAQPMITGHVNSAEWLASAEEWNLSANGRSLSGDLEDCSAIHKTGHWKNKSPLNTIKELISPYGMSVTSTAADALIALPRFALQEGETVKDAIDRLCQSVALLPMSRSDGNLELVRADVPRGRVLDLPVANCISRKVIDDEQDRHSHYYAIGQSWGNKNRSGEAVVKLKHEITDEGITRHRPIVLLAEHAVASLAALKARATWERNVRAGRSMRYACVVLGVLGPDGKPYEPGTHFTIKDDPFGVDEIMVLVRANVRANENELITELEFTLPAAFSLLVYPPKKKLNKKPKPPKPAQVCFDPSDPRIAGL